MSDKWAGLRDNLNHGFWLKRYPAARETVQQLLDERDSLEARYNEYRHCTQLSEEQFILQEKRQQRVIELWKGEVRAAYLCDPELYKRLLDREERILKGEE